MNVAFPHIIRAFDLPIPLIQWVVISYMLTFASLMLVFGRIGDMVGYRRVFLIGTAWSSVAFVLCGAAPSYTWLLAARVAQGVGGGLLLSVGPALATSLFPEAARARILGLYTMMFGAGAALGPIVAGILVQRWGWSAVFWYRLPIALTAFALTWALPASPRQPGRQTFDAAGGGLLVLSISAILLALDQLQHVGQTTVWLVVFTALAVLGLAGFVRAERRARQPIIDLDLFRDLGFSLINLGHVLIQLASFSIMLLLPFYLSRSTALSVPRTGWVLASAPLGIVLASPLAGWLAARVPPARLALIGCVLMSAGLVAVALTPDLPVLVPMMVAQGFGMGLFQVAYFDIVTATLPRSERGVAGALGMVTRTVGVTTAATVLMLLFQIVRGAAEDPQGAAAFLLAFRTTFLAAAALPVLAMGLLSPGRRYSA